MTPRSEISPDLQRFSEQDCCDVCRDQHGQLVYCSGCEVAVHGDCYGGRLLHSIPDDDWICDQCQHCAVPASDQHQLAGAAGPDPACALCPRRSGAMKLTTDYRWAHIQCALWVPEAYFRYAARSDIVDLLQIPQYRFDLECIFCHTNRGACFTCSDSSCSNPFHVPCAMAKNIQFEFKKTRTTDLVYAYCCSSGGGAAGAHTTPSVRK